MDPRRRARADASKLSYKGFGDFLIGTFTDPLDHCQDNLNCFVLDVPDDEHARGLERYLSPQHKDERDQAREDVLEAVLIRQRRFHRKAKIQPQAPRRSSIAVDGSQLQESLEKGLTQDEYLEKLRNGSRRYSRASRIFARCMGIADALAAKQVDEESSSAKDESDLQTNLPSNVDDKPKHNDSTPSPSFFNAKMVTRQPSVRELNRGIRSKAALMNAKKASRQMSMKQLTGSIRNLAATLNESGHGCLATTASASTSSDCDSNIHPSCLPKQHLCGNIGHNVRNKLKHDRILSMPRKPIRQDSLDNFTLLLQNALDLAVNAKGGAEIEEDYDDDDEEEDPSLDCGLLPIFVLTEAR